MLYILVGHFADTHACPAGTRACRRLGVAGASVGAARRPVRQRTREDPSRLVASLGSRAGARRRIFQVCILNQVSNSQRLSDVAVTKRRRARSPSIRPARHQSVHPPSSQTKSRTARRGASRVFADWYLYSLCITPPTSFETPAQETLDRQRPDRQARHENAPNRRFHPPAGPRATASRQPNPGRTR